MMPPMLPPMLPLELPLMPRNQFVVRKTMRSSNLQSLCLE
jgi:hypothetical protein